MDNGTISMDSIRSISKRYPSQSSALIQAYSDLSAAQQWVDLRLQFCPAGLDTNEFVVLRGRPNSSDKERFVYPMPLSQSTNFKTLSNLFKHFETLEDEEFKLEKKVLLAIVSNDSSIVYYELACGIVSPKEVPDE